MSTNVIRKLIIEISPFVYLALLSVRELPQVTENIYISLIYNGL